MSKSANRTRTDDACAQANRASAEAVPESFEMAALALERIVQQMESGQLPLDQMLQSYERGADLLAYCRQKLAAVETQVKVLDEGQLRAWRDEAV